MEQSEIYNQLQIVFAKVFKNLSIEITPSTNASDIDQWDSMTHLLLITEIEKEFSIEFKLKELMAMNNVGDMVSVIQSK
jgi:acyl carrier protein